jgi:hypothetical protein
MICRIQKVEIGTNKVKIRPNVDIGQKQTWGKDLKHSKSEKGCIGWVIR